MNLFTHQGIIKAFVEKLQLWITRVENNNFAQFPFINVTVGDKQIIGVHVLEHLSKLEDEFQRYFPEVDMTRDDLSFIRNSFTADVHTVPLDFNDFLCLINFWVTYWGPQSYLNRDSGPRTKMS